MKPPRLFLLALTLSLAAFAPGCGDGKPAGGSVVLFCAQDPEFAQPLVKVFEERTGIRVDLHYDAESAKTVGLVTRLIARKDHPECDVFWNNELGQTLVLKEEGVLEPYKAASAEGIPEQHKDKDGYWTGFAARARVLLYNTDSVKPEDAPKGIWDLTKPRWKGKVAIARPLFGTTFTHAVALFEVLGEEKAKEFFRALKANDIKIAPGNAMTRNMVANGEADVCLTDTDDARGAYLKKSPVAMVFPDQDGMGAFVIPHSVMLIKGGPNAENGKKLIEFLLSAEAEGLLAKSEAAQFPLRPGVAGPAEPFKIDKLKRMEVDWSALSKRFPVVKTFIESELVW
ncbi:MAG: extracellular solute-binding protein [Planctomycetes bacterium]|nr:extracellular solute-binding protein [Planctomycetota bacterium]